MPIIFTDLSILKEYHKWILSPIKYTKLYSNHGIQSEITKNVNDPFALENEIMRKTSIGPLFPFQTSGFNICENLIHIIGPDLISSEDFEREIYKCYERTINFIIESNIKEIVFPPIEFSYKRKGDLYSFRTCITMLNYFIDRYNLSDVTFYLLVEPRTVKDHLENYEPDYESTSVMSRRHKPIYYPLKNKEELEVFLYDNCIKKPKRNITKIKECHNSLLEPLCDKIQAAYNDEYDFCKAANLSKKSYNLLFDSDYIPTFDELIGICMSLALELSEAHEILKLCKYAFDYDDDRDCEIISAIATHKFNVLRFNKKLFINKFKQIGSNNK